MKNKNITFVQLLNDRKTAFSFRICTTISLLFFALFAGLPKANAQMVGVFSVAVGDQEQYGFTSTTSLTFTNPIWTVVNGTVVSSTVSLDKKTVMATVLWTTGGVGSVTIKNKAVVAATANVNVYNPSCPSPTGTLNPTVCYGQATNISLTPGSGTSTIQWFYSQYVDGSLAHTGTSMPVTLTTGRTYYARSFNPSNLCVSPLVAVQVGVQTPTVPTGTLNYQTCYNSSVALNLTPGSCSNTVQWFNDSGLTSLAHTGTTFSPTVTANKTYYARSYNTTTGAASSPVQVQITLTTPAVPTGTTNYSVCNGSSATLSLSKSGACSGTTVIQWFAKQSDVFPVHEGNTYTLTVDGPKTFYARTFNTSANHSAFVTVNVNIQTPSVPTGTTTVNVCAGSSATVTLTPGSCGSTIQWSNNSSFSTVIHTGTTFSPPFLDVTYYARTYNSPGNYSAAIPVQVNGIPVPMPTGTLTAQGCYQSTVNLSLAHSTCANTVQWFNDAGLTSLAHVGNTFSPIVTGNKTYFARSYHTVTGAASSPVQVNVSLLSIGTPSGTTSYQVCAGNTVNMSLTPGSCGAVIQWFNNTELTSLAHTGNTYSPVVTATKTYYARSFNNATGAASSVIVVNVNAQTMAIPSGTAEGVVYGSGYVFVNALAGPGTDQVKWYTEKLGGVALFTGNTYQTPVLTQTTTYFISSHRSSDNCESERIPVIVKVVPVVGAVVVSNEYIRVPSVAVEEITSLSTDEKNKSISYVDGLGRLHQQIAMASSPSGHDIVQPMEYDVFGRVSKQYLPYVATSSDGNFKPNYAQQQANFYNNPGDKVADDSHPFSISQYESAPSGRIIEQGMPGASFQPGSGHTRTFKYTFNSNNEVRKFNPDGSSTSFYAENTLIKTETVNEDGNKIIVFADKAGRTLLRKQQLDESINGQMVNYLETYYIYDDFGRVKYIISPKGTAFLAASSWTFSSSFIEQYVYQFVYDSRGRLIEKKVPGQAWMYYIYDKLNRLVLVQDGFLRREHQWLFVKYDIHNRPVMQGTYRNTVNTTRTAIQQIIDGIYTSGNTGYPENSWYEVRGASLHGYSNVSFPKTNQDNSALQVFAVSFYDTYDFDDADVLDDYSYVNQSLPGESTQTQGRARGRATGSKQLVLGTSTWLYSYMFYDEYGRVIQVRSNNHLSSARDNLSTQVYDFEGKLLVSKNFHNAGPGRTTTTINKFDYDDKGRLLRVYQNNNSAPADQLIVQYEYNELGQVVDKKLHGNGAGSFLQSVDYRYSISGQLSNINNAALSDNNINDDPDAQHDDYFGMEFLYNDQQPGLNNTPYYNGRISAVKWKGLGNEDTHSYKFGYDKTDKLKTAVSASYNGTGWTKELNALNESMTYDDNGNILSLQRNARKHEIDGITVSYGSEVIDNLVYTYSTVFSDRLMKVEDAAADNRGFANGANDPEEYTYDVNGSIAADKNKGIDTVIYNVLGKPATIDFEDGTRLEYTYDAAGSKLTMKRYSGQTLQFTTDYVGGFVYENGLLSFFGSPEGRVVKKGSTLEYQYGIADHQGNTRVVFSSATQVPDEYLATFENPATDAQNFNNVPNALPHWASFTAANNTPGGIKVVRMNRNFKTGPAKSLKVYPGDKVDMEVWTYYENSGGFGTGSPSLGALITSVAGAFGGMAGGTGESVAIFNGVDNAISLFGTGGNQGDASPAAYLNYILFDQQYNVLDMGWTRATGYNAKQKISIPTVSVKEPGFIFVYLSYENESDNYVQFDDFKVTHTKTNVIQYNEYYPFGMQTSSSWTRENNKNDFLYNAGSELNQSNGWYEMFFRGYDPALGRMLQVDPMASTYHSYSSYNYALNNPVLLNDPNGDRPVLVGSENGWFKWSMPDGSLDFTRTFQMSYEGWVDENGYFMDINALSDYYAYRDIYNHEMAFEQIGIQTQSESRANGVAADIVIDFDALPRNSQTTLYFDGNGGFVGGFQVYSRLRRDIQILACNNCDYFAQQGSLSVLQPSTETLFIASGDCCGGNGSGEKAVQSLKNEINKLERLFEEKTEPVRKVFDAIHEWYTPEHKEALEELGIDIFENLPQIDKYFKNWGPGVPFFPPPDKHYFDPPNDQISSLGPKTKK